MRKPWEIIKELRASSSTLIKESIIKRENDIKNDELFLGFNATYDILLTYGVKQIPTSFKDGPGILWNDFEKLLTQLSDRTLTGNAARAAIQSIMELSIKDEWNNWYKCILDKDLRCGVSYKTINKVVDNCYRIKKFTCQLAKDSDDHQKKLVGKKMIDTKIDGTRLLSIVYPNGHVVQYTRNGKEVTNFPQLKSVLSEKAQTLLEPYVFDGEVTSGKFQDLMKQLNRKKNVDTSDAKLNLFDWLPLKDFHNEICNIGQIQRRDSLTAWCNQNINSDLIQVLDYEIIDFDTVAGKQRFEEINRFALKNNFEGVMIKDPYAPYVLGRSDAWLKKKPVITVDLEIVGFDEGTGKYEGTLGALVCEGYDQDKFIQVNVGSGLTDKLRDQIWANKHQLKGQLVEIMADAMTLSQNSNVYSLRFPRFNGFRNDK